MTNATYYDIKDDLAAYPDAWAYLVWSKRGPGKTYSTLRYMKENGIRFMFMKRTIEDIKMLCAAGSRRGVSFDVSPWVPLNRDFGWNIKPVPILKGIAGFYECDDEDKPHGDPVGYCVALSAGKDIKGFDMSVVDYIVFDEFIPRKGDRVSRSEGDQLLDIYMTVRRDRILRGRDELKLICLANATSVNNPTFQILDITDDAVMMDIKGQEFMYQEDRKILMHALDPERYTVEEEKSGIELAMSGTAWAEMAMGGHFSYDDFTSVRRERLKGYKPLCAVIYRKKTFYLNVRDGYYYMCSAQSNVKHIYDLNRENEQKKFWYDWVSQLYDECIEDRMRFETFTMYDLIINYRKIFEI